MKLTCFALASALVLGAFARVSATTVLPISEEELAKRATVIFTGSVQDVHSAYEPDHSMIYTYIQVGITQSLKGEPREGTITLRQMGGTVGEETVILSGGPDFEPSDRVLLFAGPLGRTGYYGVLGTFYGKYDIGTDPATGRDTVTGPSFEVDHVDAATLQALPHRDRPRPIYLDDFLSEIRSYLSGN
jgi:hypothetical protein